MKYSRALKFLLLITVAVAVFLSLASVTEAQCSMCRAVLSASNNARFIRNFNLGVLVLLVPPVTMFCSIFVVLKRHHREDEESGSLGVSESGSQGKDQHRNEHS
jgi:hypothetical protein